MSPSCVTSRCVSVSGEILNSSSEKEQSKRTMLGRYKGTPQAWDNLIHSHLLKNGPIPSGIALVNNTKGSPECIYACGTDFFHFDNVDKIQNEDLKTSVQNEMKMISNIFHDDGHDGARENGVYHLSTYSCDGEHGNPSRVPSSDLAASLQRRPYRILRRDINHIYLFAPQREKGLLIYSTPFGEFVCSFGDVNVDVLQRMVSKVEGLVDVLCA
ncbi:hypothetical protein BKA69DRAFT_362500 [Paraphysoderma sedebokerense]|nr:hypothetical protein BKA69DRAFT_362500 [Paraphysoderma sedebokerense]